MKKIFCIVYTVFSLAFFSCSGDIFDNIEEHASEEKVYVGKFDKAEAFVGINRLEIDLMDAGRIPADQINIGKATQTIVEYDGKTYNWEGGVQSWINVTGLTEPKLYRIKVYNVDEYGNKSLPVETAAIPFTNEDVASLVAPTPAKLLAPTSAQFNWSNGLSSSFFDFYEMEYSYVDAQGILQTGKSTDNKSLSVLNLANGSSGVVNARLKVVPKQNNIPILDTVYLETVIDYQLPTIEKYLSERENRKVKNPFIEGNTATVTWGAATEHLVVTELMYETTSGTFNTVIVKASETTVECSGAKPDVPYKTRSGFVPPGAVDTLYKDWVTSRYPFFSIPDGTYLVSSNSYRYFESSGEPTAARPQNEYVIGTTVTVEGTEEGAYKISDLFGGYYEYGRGYGSAYRCWGIVSFDDALLDFILDPWPYGWNTADVISWDLATKTFTVDIYWDGTYVFRLALVKQD
ncbi:MAG: DUF4998 domain-containing protein [Prevotellaceae bacterium]|jgi:hypothetical protein|nr:DUF4998 domain-containing protein [Prevotellaceae bacterium]